MGEKDTAFNNTNALFILSSNRQKKKDADLIEES